MFRRCCFLTLATTIFLGCSEKQPEKTLFDEQSSEQTGIDFENKVIQDQDNHVLNYPYYFNGGGVAVGDINNDGLADIYFSGNSVSNQLYLNKGNFQFEDITEKAGVGVEEGWKTGVSLVDINQDGWLDIYVSRSAMSDSLLRKNLIFINNGNETFTEQADQFGIGDNAYSTHAAFFDYDKDGDIDMFVLNHSLPKYAGFSNMLVNFKKQESSLFQSKLFQNNNGKFTDVSTQAGIISNVLSFGLGLAVSDINNDGWPDIYVSNDFNEEDYLYINNQNGTFKNATRDALGHVSLFSMGSDIVDVNNDALPDIFTLDMQPESNERIKLSSGDDNYDKYAILIKAGFYHQSMRNMFQLNNGNGTFSEVGQLMGISNTDWSWSALFADFDGDGWKDLFVSNGYEKDYTNMQFLKYTVDERMKSRQTGAPPDIKEIIGQMPAIQVGNFLFKNNGDLTFTKKTKEWGITRSFKSNGAAYADLDNDGDLDLIINTMNEKAAVFRNTSSENKSANFLTVDLRKLNPTAIIIGTKVMVYVKEHVQYQEFSPVRGFQSAMYAPLSFGIPDTSVIDSIRVIWPDNKTQLLENVSVSDVLTPKQSDATVHYKYPAPLKPWFTESHLLDWKHSIAETNDFKKQLLLPKMFSYTGPGIAKGDVNKDGLDDLYVCGGRAQAGALFLQQKDGSFKEKKIQAFDQDRGHQDEDAVFVDVDQDGDVDLYVVSGGYYFQENDPLLQDRLYLNDGVAGFSKSVSALPLETLAGSCVVSFDIDGDNDLDFFVGTRFTPGQYPVSAPSLLLQNDGKGKFIRITHPLLQNLGMVTSAISLDLNKDGKQDLIVTGEWMPIKIFINSANGVVDASDEWITQPATGWWNCIAAEDFDNDGDVDLIVGNYGQNNSFGVSAEHPATMVYKDFNQDGQVDPFFCYYIGDQSYPYASRDEALGQVATLRGRFPDYTTYSTATLETMFTKQELENSRTLSAKTLKTSMFENVGSKFEFRELPVEVQFSPVHAIAVNDVDHDGDKDIVLGGNESMVRVRIGKSDANKGILLLNDGKGNFSYVHQDKSGLNLQGDVQRLLFISTKDQTKQLVAGETGSTVKSYKLDK